ERIARAVRVERILEPLAGAAAHDLVLVFDARIHRELEREMPQVRAVETRQRLRRRQAVDPVAQVHRVGVAAIHPRDRLALDDREGLARHPRVDGFGRVRAGLEIADRAHVIASTAPLAVSSCAWALTMRPSSMNSFAPWSIAMQRSGA